MCGSCLYNADKEFIYIKRIAHSEIDAHTQFTIYSITANQFKHIPLTLTPTFLYEKLCSRNPLPILTIIII